MVQELGPNLWEYKLERCVDYGHSFSKIIEMVAEPSIMHGEAVNVDGLFCVVLAQRRNLITTETRDRVLKSMQQLKLPTFDKSCTKDVMWKGLVDAIEHRHGQQRLPLIAGIGQYTFVNDITLREIEDALVDFKAINTTRSSQNGH